MVYLGKVDLEKLEESLQEAIDEGDSWESFSSGFNTSSKVIFQNVCLSVSHNAQSHIFDIFL